jgi:RNA polymerase subunit RPABC4/transcription elongation factor Spt4
MTPIIQKIFSCPGCSLRVSGQESACPRCGKEFGPDIKLECPFCGTLVPPHSNRCPSCQIDYLEFMEKAEVHLLEKALEKIVEEIDDLRLDEKPKNEEHLSTRKPLPEPGVGDRAPEAVCPMCKTVVTTSDEVCPSCGAVFEMDTPDEMVGHDERACCPICGEIVGMDVVICPFCGAEFETEDMPAPEPLRAEPVRVFKKPRIIPRPKSVHDRRGLVAEPPELEAWGDSDVSNGVSVTNGISKINGKGRINGRGQINGVHFVNGRGAVNGRDLVNGTGILNGSGARRHYEFERSGKTPFYIRWQFVAILVAIAIVVPSFLHLVNTGEEEPYSIDGDFGDWDSRIMFTAMSIAPDQDAQGVEWSIDTRDDTVYLYVRAAEDLMASSEAERFVLFIDCDDSNGTGYSIGGAGADFMAEMSGWNGSVRSSTLLEFRSDGDQLNWSRWSNARHVKSTVAGNQLEAMARLSTALNESAKFILAAQTELGGMCVSYPVTADCGLLIVEQRAADGISAEGILRSGSTTAYMRLRFTCQGNGGTVESVVPTLTGISSFEPIESFALDAGEERMVDLLVDSSALTYGEFVSATVTAEGLSSTFQYLQVVGGPVCAYAYAPPQDITIDGAFADWAGRTTTDTDGTTLENPNVDIDQVGTDSADENSYFFVSVHGTLCAGVYVPKTCTSRICSGGATTAPSRCTAEDFIRIYIDSDRSNASGRFIEAGAMTIGADHMIEVCGLCCEIISVNAYLYVAGTWALVPVSLDAAKDESKMEIGVGAEAVGDSDNIDFLIEATDWRGETDYASNQTTLQLHRAWAVDSTGTSEYATSLSYQRKLFYDGANFWSFYFDGADTVCSYSDDGGETWTSRGSVFKTAGVRKASIWYDAGNSVVYAVGDRASSTRNIYVQKGSVSSGSSEISWAASDAAPTVSTEGSSEKNSYISRDSNGYIWILCTDVTKTSPTYKYQLESWQSNSVNDVTAWTSRGDLLPSAQTQDGDVCGSIVPAGTGSDMWAVFAYEGEVYGRKYSSGSWESGQEIYSDTGTQEENTVNSPPSVLVGSDKVVHVVYGDKSEDGGFSKPKTWYTHNNTGASTWVPSSDLNTSKPSDVGNKYPTISVDSVTGDLYVFWMRTDAAGVPKTVMGVTKSDGGSWTSLSFGTQTPYTKHYLTSIYTVEGVSNVCWLWTQNTTGTIEVFFEIIPEFGDVVVPVFTILAVFIAVLGGRRHRGDGVRRGTSHSGLRSIR